MSAKQDIARAAVAPRRQWTDHAFCVYAVRRLGDDDMCNGWRRDVLRQYLSHRLPLVRAVRTLRVRVAK